ncbi:YegP family protein [Yangia sp. PrR002]|nr:YegP family protein [Salipiger sp. PrR002]NDW59991.1 YegP family protein [Salipiger sp. PrR004]
MTCQPDGTGCTMGAPKDVTRKLEKWLESSSFTRTRPENGIGSVRRNAPLDERYERKATSSGKPMFNLKASNGQVIGTSEAYSSEPAREAGIASVKINAEGARLVDQVV